jgi:hypothetical protein
MCNKFHTCPAFLTKSRTSLFDEGGLHVVHAVYKSSLHYLFACFSTLVLILIYLDST